MTYDLIIIGGGPAGVSGAVYAARKRLKTLLIAQEFGGQSAVSTDIQNWIGTPHISGIDFAKIFKTHVEEYKGEFLEIKEGAWVTDLKKNTDGTFEVATSTEPYTAHSVLVATGSGRRKLDVKGAVEFENKGITYCASCDGPLFANMDVAVIGGGNAGFDSAAQLLAYCKSVTLIHRSDNFKADEITIKKVEENPKAKILKNMDILEIKGEQFVTSIVVQDKNTKVITELPVSGIFVEIGQIPNTDFVKNIIKLDEVGKIPVDHMNMRTYTEGIWCAGDASNGLYHQNNIAAGDAVKALEDIYIWLHQKK
jgi:alkyl hydroperoxide reductase subunit F